MLRAPDAILFVQMCRARNARMLGIDAFILTDHTTQPITEQSIHLSDSKSLASPGNSWDEAEAFLKSRIKTDLFFEIVIEQQA